jgi:DNA-binding LacI/PurR family transcriptional regulator
VLDAIAPRAVLRFGEPYLTGHELDDSGGGWRDGLAAHMSAQVGYLAGRGHTRIAYAARPRHPLRAVRLRFADLAAGRLGLSPVAPFSIPVFRTGAADSLAEIRAARPAVTAVAAFDDDVAPRHPRTRRRRPVPGPGRVVVRESA